MLIIKNTYKNKKFSFTIVTYDRKITISTTGVYV